MAIDCEATARLVLMDFAHDIMEVVHRLQVVYSLFCWLFRYVLELDVA